MESKERNIKKKGVGGGGEGGRRGDLAAEGSGEEEQESGEDGEISPRSPSTEGREDDPADATGRAGRLCGGAPEWSTVERVEKIRLPIGLGEPLLIVGTLPVRGRWRGAKRRLRG